MSPASMVAALKKLEGRTLAVEQILPTLATKEDLKAFATKDDLNEVKRMLRALHEDLKSDIGLLAEHLVDVMTRLPPREAR